MKLKGTKNDEKSDHHLQCSNKLGKNGLTVFSDMGLFFNHNKIDELLKHETKLFMSSFLINTNKMKIFCCYNVSDLNLLTYNEKNKTFLVIIIELSEQSQYCQVIVPRNWDKLLCQITDMVRAYEQQYLA
jgi:hypothetical protein